MGRDTVQLETAVSTISQEYLLEFTSEYVISEALHPELPGPRERIVDFPEGKVGMVDVFQQETGEKHPSMLYQAIGFPKKLEQQILLGGRKGIFYCCGLRTSAPKDEMPAENTYSSEAVMVLNTHCTPIQKQPEALLCLVGLSRRYFLGDEVYPTFLHDNDRDMDLFNLIRAPNPTKVKSSTRPCAAHEVPLLTVTTSRVIEMEDSATTTDSSRAPSTIERSPLDFANKNPSQQSTGEAGQAKGIGATGPHVIKERRKRGNDGVDTNAPPKVLKRDHADSRPTQSTHGGKSLTTMGLEMGSTRPVPTSR
nr:hypothetical protein [Tanacetum cinerariifolium]